MKWQQAWEIGIEVVEAMSPACDRIMIAGSVRRAKPEPKDVEIVYSPRMQSERVDLFSYGDVPATEALIRDLVNRSFWNFDKQVKRNGPLYKRMVQCPLASGEPVVIELFRANHDNWGYILALRTGPGDFNKIWAAHSWDGGCLPADVTLRDGYLWRGGKPLATPSEGEFFAAIGLPCWQPEERSAIHLAKFLVDRRNANVQRAAVEVAQ